MNSPTPEAMKAAETLVGEILIRVSRAIVGGVMSDDLRAGAFVEELREIVALAIDKAVEREREACAMLLESSKVKVIYDADYEFAHAANATLAEAASAIRSRSRKPQEDDR